MLKPSRYPAIAALAVLLPLSAQAGADLSGVATWYGARHDGRRTSSGDIFHMNAMTAASSRIPLGTKVRVTMRDTGSSVVVLVNDRMGGRALIDLSRGAAKQIGLYARGRGLVSVQSTADEPVEVADATGATTDDATMRPVMNGRSAATAQRHDLRFASLVEDPHTRKPRARRHAV